MMSTIRVVESFTQIEVFDPHTGRWKEQAEAMKDRPRPSPSRLEASLWVDRCS